MTTSRLPIDARARKAVPIATGVLDYFPDALVEVARCSQVGNDQHNPGQPLHWSKGKSTDHADSLLRHMLDRGTIDGDGIAHSAKVAWRALAMLQTEIEAAQARAEVTTIAPFPGYEAVMQAAVAEADDAMVYQANRLRRACDPVRERRATDTPAEGAALSGTAYPYRAGMEKYVGRAPR